MERFKNILYVNEPSVDRQETALARAVSLAERNRARLTVVDVIPAITAGYFARISRPTVAGRREITNECSLPSTSLTLTVLGLMRSAIDNLLCD